MNRKALILVDIQNDFMEGGSLEVPNASEILPVVKNLLELDWHLVVATKDWHPEGHKSFASSHGKNVFDVIDLNGVEQVMWPDHCVAGTKGSEIHPDLNSYFAHINEYVVKGADPEVDSYSGFFDNNKVNKTELDDILKDNEIDMVYIVGLATDYCVKFTALDANELEYWTFVITDGVRGLDGAEGALKEMEDAGVDLITSKQVII